MRYIGVILAALLVGCDNVDAPQARSDLTNRTPSETNANSDSNSLPVVLIDASHAMHPNQTSTKPYLSQSTSGIVLDGTRFTCHDPKNQGRTPNVVQVLYDHSEFKLDWPATGKRSVTLDASTMKVLKGNRFDKFSPGTQAIIAVGYRDDRAASQPNAQPFDPFWVGSVLFQ